MKICKCGGHKVVQVGEKHWMCEDCGRINQYIEEKEDASTDNES